MIVGTSIEIITAQKAWTTYRYLTYDTISRSQTEKLKDLYHSEEIEIINPEKLMSDGK